MLEIKGESRKRWQLLDMIVQQILILGLKTIKQGQNKISRALIWGKVCLCRPNMTGDMIKNVKTVIFKKCHILQFCSINENPCFFFFIISLVMFGLQRRTLHQIKALDILFWPYVIIFSPWSIFVEQLRQEIVSFVFRVAQTVFVPNFYIPLIWQLFSFFYEFFHLTQRNWCIWFHKKKNCVFDTIS